MFQDISMITAVVLVSILESVSSSDNFNISNVPMLISPAACDSHVGLVIIIHSHPQHRQLRQTLRKTWADENINPELTKTKTVFVVGLSDADEDIREEANVYSDVIQGGFIDSYRNMTIKHLLGYRWVADNCRDAGYVLKSDDDQFIDTFQLSRYLATFLPSSAETWYLCQVLTSGPHRHQGSKWFVTEEEWPQGAEYPAYCAGWAYVTTVTTVVAVLDWSHHLPFFWIDDIHVTGIIPHNFGGVPLYNWVYSFLTTHITYR